MTSGEHERRKEERTHTLTHRPVESGLATKPTGLGPGLGKLLFAFTNRHRGKALELDSGHDTMRVLGPRGEELAVVSSEVALDHLLGCAQQTTTPARPEVAPPPKDVPRRPAPIRVSARGGDGRQYEGLCPIVGRSGLFLELAPAPAPGTQLDMAITCTDGGSRTLRVKGAVAWACPGPDEFGFGPGVGVTCTWHSPELAALLSDADGPPSR